VAGEAAFARVWAEGQAMTLGEAIAVALLGGELPHEDGSRQARRSTASPGPSSEWALARRSTNDEHVLAGREDCRVGAKRGVHLEPVAPSDRVAAGQATDLLTRRS